MPTVNTGNEGQGIKTTTLSRSAERIYENLQSEEIEDCEQHARGGQNTSDEEITQISNRFRRSLVFEPEETAETA